MDLVVARFNESLDTICALVHAVGRDAFRDVIVYNKGGEIPPGQLPECTRVVSLPNVGWCDYTYLHHIVESYDTLAPVTVFLPASCNHPNAYEWRCRASMILSLATLGLDALPVDHVYQPSARDALKDARALFWEPSSQENRTGENSVVDPCPEAPYSVWFDKVFGPKHTKYVSCRGYFAASRALIRNSPRELYRTLRNYLDHHIHPEAAHFMELSWMACFEPIPLEAMICCGAARDAMLELYPGDMMLGNFDANPIAVAFSTSLVQKIQSMGGTLQTRALK